MLKWRFMPSEIEFFRHSRCNETTWIELNYIVLVKIIIKSYKSYIPLKRYRRKKQVDKLASKTVVGKRHLDTETLMWE